MLSTQKSRTVKQTGFTLVELLVVIAIIGVLVALLLPAIQAAREASRRSSCSNQLKQLGLGLQHYHDTYKSFMYGSRQTATPAKTDMVGWTVYILPFMEQQSMFDQFKTDLNWNEAPNAVLATQRMQIYLCPSGPKVKADDNTAQFTTHYYGMMGATGINPSTGTAYLENTSGSHGGFSRVGIFYQNEVRGFIDVIDGTSNTIAFGEISWSDRRGLVTRYRAWSRGGRNNDFMAPCKNMANQINSDQTVLFNDMSYGSNHPGGCHFALVDGSVKFVGENIDYNALLSAASMNGSEVLGLGN